MKEVPMPAPPDGIYVTVFMAGQSLFQRILMLPNGTVSSDEVMQGIEAAGEAALRRIVEAQARSKIEALEKTIQELKNGNNPPVNPEHPASSQ